MVWDALGNDAKDQNSKSRERLIGVYIGILAVLLALCTLGGGNSTKDATLKNIEASNTWGFFQAKNMRRHVLRLQADDLELRLATETGLTDAGKDAIRAKIKSYKDQDDALTKGPEGLDGLFTKGKALEAERDVAMKRDPYFDYGTAFLQIAIVLASVAIVTDGTVVLLASLFIAVLGVLMTLNGFTLAIAVPFMG
jgi:Domain of unknown function (DUF4337)